MIWTIKKYKHFKFYYHEKIIIRPYGKGKIKPGGYVKCDFKVVSSGCLADDLWSGFGCVELSNCSFKIEW